VKVVGIPGSMTKFEKKQFQGGGWSMQKSGKSPEFSRGSWQDHVKSRRLKLKTKSIKIFNMGYNSFLEERLLNKF